jgi:glutamate-1-semialdehyde 2,1-aminomutase
VIGKSIGGGIPCGAYGISGVIADMVQRLASSGVADIVDVGGIGGTLAGNALSTTAMRATLSQVLTAEAFVKMIDLGTRYTAALRTTIDDHRLPWSVSQLGARAEYRFAMPAPKDGNSSAAAEDPELNEYLHLFLCNRGVLLTPFHNMALMCPATIEEDVRRHTGLFAEAAAMLTS